MPGQVKPVPDGYHTATPHLIIDGAAEAIEFYKNVFGASEIMRMPGPGGIVGHAEIQIGDSRIMMADEHPEMGARGPGSIGGSPVMLLLYVDDVDAVVEKAVAAGAKILQAVEDKFYGDRAGCIEDPFGHRWGVATHVEDVCGEELARRAAEMEKGAD